MLTAWMDDELQTLETQALRRRLRLMDSALVNFGSNDYLALARHPEVLKGAETALRDWGISAASSRLLSGHTQIHCDLEASLADWLTQEAALVFPAGYMANLGVITALAHPGDAIIMDRLCHASLIDAARLSGARLLVYRHGDAADAERVLKRCAAYRRRFLVTESLFSMDGDYAPLDPLRALAKAYQALAIVDEAHALGVFGLHGSGLSRGWDIVLGTLSKSLGSQGGFAAGSKQQIEYVLNKARPFIFTTGLSPVCAGAALAALRVLRGSNARAEELQGRAEHLRGRLTAQGWNLLKSQSQIIPLYVGTPAKALDLTRQLRTKGFYAPAIRPPTVHAKACRLRVSVTLHHTTAQVDRLADLLGECHE